MPQNILFLIPTDFHPSLCLNSEELLQLPERTLKKSPTHKEPAQIDLTYETALWVTAALLGDTSALATRKKGEHTSLLARSKQNKTPNDPLTLSSWWKTEREIKNSETCVYTPPSSHPCKKTKKERNDKCEELRNEQHFTRAY